MENNRPKRILYYVTLFIAVISVLSLFTILLFNPGQPYDASIKSLFTIFDVSVFLAISLAFTKSKIQLVCATLTIIFALIIWI